MAAVKARLMKMFVWERLRPLRDHTDGVLVVHAPDLESTYAIVRHECRRQEFSRLATDEIIEAMRTEAPSIYRGRAAVIQGGGG